MNWAKCKHIVDSGFKIGIKRWINEVAPDEVARFESVAKVIYANQLSSRKRLLSSDLIYKYMWELGLGESWPIDWSYEDYLKEIDRILEWLEYSHLVNREQYPRHPKKAYYRINTILEAIADADD